MRTISTPGTKRTVIEATSSPRASFSFTWLRTKRAALSRFEAVLEDRGLGVARAQILQPLVRRLGVRGLRVHASAEHRHELHLGRQRADVVDAGDLAQLRHLLEAELELPARHQLADQHARRRLVRLRFELLLQSQSLEELRQVDAA